MLRSFDIPFWPQLPRLSFHESMIVQYSEGMPYLRINEQDQVAWVMRDSSDELERFYESCSDMARIAISEDYAAGLHAFLKMIRGRRFPLLKGHVTGPVTYTLGLKDNYGRYVFFDEELREVSSMLLKAKIRWQVDMLKQHADGVVIFIDEPILSALGSSSYLGVDAGEAERLLKDSISAVEEAGGIPGIHCCGRADWPMVLRSGAGIVNFDAFEYFDSLALYHDEVKQFLEGGGYLAWGMVPTSDAIGSIDDAQLASRIKEHIGKLGRSVSPELVASRLLLTPSCGTGSRSIEETTRIFQLLMRLKEDAA
ncbi:MAG: hypothetical protein AB1805_11265 [Nitrospirota bacterium]